MKYQLLVDKRIEKQLEKIPTKDYLKIKAAILGLTDNPRPQGFKKLAGRSGFRIRVGDYRIIYLINDALLQVVVVSAGNRKDIYN